MQSDTVRYVRDSLDRVMGEDTPSTEHGDSNTTCSFTSRYTHRRNVNHHGKSVNEYILSFHDGPAFSSGALAGSCSVAMSPFYPPVYLAELCTAIENVRFQD